MACGIEELDQSLNGRYLMEEKWYGGITGSGFKSKGEGAPVRVESNTTAKTTENKKQAVSNPRKRKADDLTDDVIEIED